jgi:hypothetical protein
VIDCMQREREEERERKAQTDRQTEGEIIDVEKEYLARSM